MRSCGEKFAVLAAVLVLSAACDFTGATPQRAIDAAPIDARIDAGIDAGTDANPLDDCTGLSVTDPADQVLTDGADLSAAISLAAPGDIVELGAGTYAVSAVIPILVDDITIRGFDPLDPGAVTIAIDPGVDGFDVTSSNFTIGNLTITGGTRQIRVSGSAAADETGFVANSLVSRDAEGSAIRADGYNQFHPSVVTDRFSHDGTILCSQFTAEAVCDNDTGLIIEGSDRWRISKNRMFGYDCSGASAMHVRTSDQPIIDRNTVDGFTNGIRVGQFTAQNVGLCNPAGTEWSVRRGVVCNNDLFQRNGQDGHAVLLAQACETVVIHNSIYQTTARTGIRAAEANSLVFAGNNLVNTQTDTTEAAIFDLGLLPTNQLDAPDSAYADPSTGKLTPVVGQTRTGSNMMALMPIIGDFCSRDRQGRPRSLSMPNFVGAYEEPQ